jgi:glycerol-3-phosphate dehydrogenase (NAD(P)+)
MNSSCPLLVLGAGSWGTALAIHIAKQGQRTLLWGRDPIAQARMQHDRENKLYLPEIIFPEHLELCLDLKSQSWERVLIVVPSNAFTVTLNALKPYLAANAEVVWATKGLDQGRFLHEIAEEILGPISFGALSGPSFAKEVAMGAFSALVLASDNAELRKSWHQLLHTPTFRLYLSEDLIGLGLGGLVKNILALAVGIAEGLGLGANARSALITRGLAEMMRLGKKLGAKRSTLAGLSGLGDTILSATENQSRNRRCGVLLGHGIPIEEAVARIGQVVESIHNSAPLVAIAKEQDVELPICEAVNNILRGNYSPQEAFLNLMQRPVNKE